MASLVMQGKDIAHAQTPSLSVRAQNGTLPAQSSRAPLSPGQDLAAARQADRDALRVQRNRQLGFPDPGFAFPTPGLALPPPFAGFPRLDPNFPPFNNGIAQPGWATTLPAPNPGFMREFFAKPPQKPLGGLEAPAGAGPGLDNPGKGARSSVFVGAQFQEALRRNGASPAPKVVSLPQDTAPQETAPYNIGPHDAAIESSGQRTKMHAARKSVNVVESMLFSRKITLTRADTVLVNRFALRHFDRDRNATLTNQEAGAAARALLGFADIDLSGTLSLAEWQSLRRTLEEDKIIVPKDGGR